ncbi:MAG: diadenylate cyclase CdaA [Spirochaetaceae bacterium]|jgi:diadenylate cyclase|nr:diadenylate cyclase CdaA [Spirochaetaceae bacterium]
MEWFQSLRGIYDFIRPVLDIAVLSFLIYAVYELLIKTQAAQMLKGAGYLALLYGVAILLQLKTLLWILQALVPGFLVAVAIIFQPELRKIILRLGQSELFRSNSKPLPGHLDAVVGAAEVLSRERRGMLIVFPRRVNIQHVIDTGTRINGDISTSLLVAIFEFDGPLHDGATIVQNGKIAAAGCFLPLSEQQDIKKSFGTRHRASLGMSEQSDAVVLVVSEETGALSVAFDGKLYYDLSPAEATRKLSDLIEQGKGQISGKGALSVKPDAVQQFAKKL